MPYDPTAGSGFKGVGLGLLETYFGNVAQERQKQDRQKDSDLARQLAAYHALAEHKDTLESDIPGILDASAKLLKIEKEFAPITQHMREGMKRRVPTGPAGSSEMPVLPTPQGATEALGQAPDNSQPYSIDTRPTREYGELSQGEAQDYRHQQAFENQQTILIDKQRQQQEAMTARALAVESQKALTKAAQLETEYKLKRDLLEPKERLAADKQRSGYEQALLAQLGGSPTDEQRAWARQKAGEMVITGVDAVVAQRNASAEASRATAENRKAQIKHWNNQDAHAIRMEATAGMSAASLREFNANTREVWPELSRVKSEIIRLQTLKSALGAGNTTFDSQLQSLEEKRDGLQLRIDDARKSLQSTVPTSGSGDGKFHYTPDQIRRSLKPGQNYNDVLRQLQARPNVVIDQQ